MSRRDMLAKVHIARKELGLEDEDYRAVLIRATGKPSSSDCSDAELSKALVEFRRLGWKARPRAKGHALPNSTKPYVRLIHALWKSCAAKGVIQDGSRQALRSFVEPRAGVSDPDFLTMEQARPIIDALKAMEARG